MCKALRCDPPQAAQWLKLSPDVTQWVRQGALRIGPPPVAEPAPAPVPVRAPAAPPAVMVEGAPADPAELPATESPAPPPAPPAAPVEPEKVLYAMPIPGQPGRSHGIWVTPAQLAEIHAGARVTSEEGPPPGAPPPLTDDVNTVGEGLDDDEDTAAAVENAARVESPADDGQPSAAWTHKRLAELAKTRGIDCEGKSKSWILREIRMGGRQ